MPVELWEAHWKGRVEGIRPRQPDHRWSFLGYDVIDAYLQSDLSNQVFFAGEGPAAMQAAWAPHLNDNHLFDAVDVAQSFAEFSNTRDTDHAPFFVCGLWRVPDDDTDLRATARWRS
jgi:hypothetical protein